MCIRDSFIDSQAAILALNNNKITSQLVYDAIVELNHLSINKTVIINWTKAHVGTPGNERADVLAKTGAREGGFIDIGLPKSELKRKITDYFYSRWTDQFNEYKKARMGKLFYSKPDSVKAKHVMKLSRMQLARFIRIISGHNSLFYFKSKIDSSIKPECRFCREEDETFYHLVNECPSFNESCREFFLDKNITNNHEWSAKDLIDFSFIPSINAALEGSTDIHLFGNGYISSGGEEFDEEGVG